MISVATMGHQLTRHPRPYPNLIRMGIVALVLISVLGGCTQPVKSVPSPDPTSIKMPPPARTYRLLTMPIEADNITERNALRRWVKKLRSLRSLEYQPLPAPENWTQLNPKTEQGREKIAWLQADHVMLLKTVKNPYRQVALSIWSSEQAKPLWQERISYINSQDLVLALRLMKRRLHRFLGDAVWIILEPQPTAFLTFPDAPENPLLLASPPKDQIPTPMYGADNIPLSSDLELPAFLHTPGEEPQEEVQTPPQEQTQPPPTPPEKKSNVQAYTVQVGAFQDRGRATKLVHRLQSLGYNTMLNHYLNSNQETWYFVWMGKYATRQQAIKAGEAFTKAMGERPFITRIHALHNITKP
ncbi:SPOR domain-containing protein [Magnetococcus sp. PR-3]|uniref:SPOR domain-containing protein n=1 Tax=Magnetococcus sp. PR-3 TaxID=3120355 RepID=UPI002FCDF0F6